MWLVLAEALEVLADKGSIDREEVTYDVPASVNQNAM
jgi:hypothetical protein